MTIPNTNLMLIALDSARMLRGSYILMVPAMVASVLLFFVLFGLFAGLDPELFNDMETFLLAPETERALLIGTAFYAVLSMLALGATTAMCRVLVERGRTTLDDASAFISARGAAFIGLSMIMGLSMVVGLTIFLLPGIAVVFFMMYAMPALVMGAADPLDAMQKSFSTVMGNFRQSFWLFFSLMSAYLVLNMALMALVFIPVIGILGGFVFTAAHMAVLAMSSLRAYNVLNPPADTAAPPSEPRG